MSVRPPEGLKPFANRLAELLDTDVGPDVLSLMRTVGLFATDAPDRPAGRADRSDRPSIGIWEPEPDGDGTHYVRTRRSEPWAMWADVERIVPKRGRRILLFGESVARGYFYDPYFNPAAALQSILRQAVPSAEVDVVDLARIDHLLEPMLQLARAAAALEPDALVFFAGNNWRTAETLRRTAPFVVQALRQRRSFREINRVLESHLRAMADAFLGALGQMSRAWKIPVVAVIPEFNLSGWASTSDAAPYLPGGHNDTWLRLFSAATMAFDGGDLDGAERFATEMIDLDDGICEASLAMIAKCRMARGDRDVRQALEAVRDAELWTPRKTTPRCYGVIQQTLRAGAAAHGVLSVDLPQVFERYLAGGPPGRRLFHDYCHLTAEGIVVAMAVVAERLLPSFGGPAVAWTDLARQATVPTDAQKAEASFVAAVHNASWGQPYDTVRYGCEEAVRLSPKMLDVLEGFLRCQLRRMPNILCREFERLHDCQVHSVERFLGLGIAEGGEKLFQRHLVSAIADVLQAHARPEAATRADYDVVSGGAELTEPYYWSSGYHEIDVRRDTAVRYYQSHTLASTFSFFVSQPVDLSLSVTLRAPERDDPGCAQIAVNSQHVAAVPVQATWLRSTLHVPGTVLKPGVNQLVIRWPLPRAAGDGGLDRAARQIELGLAPTVHPTLGEVFSCRLGRPGIDGPADNSVPCAAHVRSGQGVRP